MENPTAETFPLSSTEAQHEEEVDQKKKLRLKTSIVIMKISTNR
jgi:hypothetical protein